MTNFDLANTRRSRPLAALALTLVTLVALSGCFKFDMGLKVSPDDTISGTFILAVDESMTEMMEDTDDNPYVTSGMPDGATVEPYAADGKVGQKVTFDSVTLDEFNKAMVDEDTNEPFFTLTRDGDTFKFNGTVTDSDYQPPTTMATTEAEKQMAEQMEALTKQMFQGAEFTVSIEFPGKILDTNGTVDGNKVTWNVDVLEPVDMTATADATPGTSDTEDTKPAVKSPTDNTDDTSVSIVMVALLFAGVALVAMWVFWKKRKTQ